MPPPIRKISFYLAVNIYSTPPPFLQKRENLSDFGARREKNGKKFSLLFCNKKTPTIQTVAFDLFAFRDALLKSFRRRSRAYARTCAGKRRFVTVFPVHHKNNGNIA